MTEKFSEQPIDGAKSVADSLLRKHEELQNSEKAQWQMERSMMLSDLSVDDRRNFEPRVNIGEKMLVVGDVPESHRDLYYLIVKAKTDLGSHLLRKQIIKSGAGLIPTEEINDTSLTKEKIDRLEKGFWKALLEKLELPKREDGVLSVCRNWKVVFIPDSENNFELLKDLKTGYHFPHN